jgi:hypothetical protein
MLVDILGPAAFAVLVSSNSCAIPPSPPQVVFSIVVDPVRFDNTLSVAELTARGVNIYKPPGFVGTGTRGLTSSKPDLFIDPKLERLRWTKASVACSRLKEVKVSIRLEFTVFIHKGTKPGSCEYNAILDHEEKHVRVDDAVAAKYVPGSGPQCTLPCVISTRPDRFRFHR